MDKHYTIKGYFILMGKKAIIVFRGFNRRHSPKFYMEEIHLSEECLTTMQLTSH